MKKDLRKMPVRITAAVLAAGLIVSSSNLENIRWNLLGGNSIRTVVAAEHNVTLDDANLLKAMEVIVNCVNKGVDLEELKKTNGADLTSDKYKDYQTTITESQASQYKGFVDLSGCKGINNLSGLKVFNNIEGIDITSYSGSAIPADAFLNCKSMEKVVISGKITNIEASAFQGCNSLKTLEVKGDGNNAEGVLNLIKIKKIGDSAFNAAKRFEGIVFDAKATDLEIGSNAFSQCERLKEVNVPTKDLGNLGQGVFSDCTLLSKVTLNDNLTGIPNYFFQGANLSRMDHFPSKLQKIGKDSFANTYLLTPDLSKCTNLTLIDAGAFQVDTFTRNEATDNEFRLPASLKDDGIKEIAFLNSTLEKINIPDGITVIAESTFEGCTELTTVTTTKASKLEKIEPWAFRRCDSLGNTDFLKDMTNLKEIGDYAFAECFSIAMTITIKNTSDTQELLSLLVGADYDEEKKEYSFPISSPDAALYVSFLETLIPSETINCSTEGDDYGIYSFAGGLANVTLPASLTTLGDYAFANNYALQKISMGNNVKELPKYVFALRADTAHKSSTAANLQKLNGEDLKLNWEKLSYSSQMTDVTLSNKLTDIGEGAFRYNTKLSTVTYGGAEKKENTLTLPSTVKNIGDNAFSDCARWSDGDEKKEIPRVAYGLTNVDLGNLAPETLGKSIFEKDFMLETVILPKNLEVIPEKMFISCGKRVDTKDKDTNKVTKESIEWFGLKNVTFPNNVTEISESAFKDCVNLEYRGKKYIDNKIELNQLPDTLEVIGNNAFNGCVKLGKIALNTNLIKIGENAFSGCSLSLNNKDSLDRPYYEEGFGLTNISFVPAKQLESIGKEAFSKTPIPTADLSNNTLLETIPSSLFADCYSMDSSELPYSVTKVEGKVYSNNVRIRTVQLPQIASVSKDIFNNIDAGYFDQMVRVTLAARNEDRKIVVPIGQSITLNFIQSNGMNEYDYVQTANGEVLKNEDDQFVECLNDGKKITLMGKKPTSENSTLRITNYMRFDVSNDNKTVQIPKTLSADYNLTVSDILAEKLVIDGTKAGADIQQTEKGKVLTISADKITGNDATNTLEISASVEPSTVTKAPIWGVDGSDDVITVDEIDADDTDTINAVNKGNVSKAVVHVKGVGTATLWVADSDSKKVIDQVTVNVVYPVTGIDYSVTSLDAASNSIELEKDKTDKISVDPKYKDNVSEEDDAAKAQIYFESDNPEIVEVDSATGKLKAGEQEGSTTIRIKDSTGKELQKITVKVVPDGELQPKTIQITPDDISVYKDEDVRVTAKVYPEGASQNVEWSLKNGGENTVVLKSNEDGSATVTGKALGNTTLYAKSEVNNTSANIPISVTVAADTFEFQGDQSGTVQVAVDDTKKNIKSTNTESDDFSLYYLPKEASGDTVTWEIEDDSIATIDATKNLTIGNGVPAIQGLKQGETTLTATTGSGKTASVKVVVFDPISEFTVDEQRTVQVGETIKLDVTKIPADSKETFTFESRDGNIATVDADGNVKGIKDGSVSITVKTSKNMSKTCTVTVVSKVSQITILDAPIELSVGNTYSIERARDDKSTTGYRLFPESSDELTWYSSNPGVATVESNRGKATIKAEGQGTAVLTATAVSGATATITVTVVDAIDELKFTEESKNVAVGKTTIVTANKAPATSAETIEYTSSDEKIATVDQNGVVTGVSKGKVTITAKGKVSGKTAGITVNVTLPATKVQILTKYASEKKIYLVKGSSYQLKSKLTPEQSTDEVKYSSNKKKVATVSEDGTIKAKKKGTATITVKADSGKKATIKVYVVNKEKKAKKIKKISTSSVKVGKTVRLKYTVTPANTTDSVRYSVDKSNIAKVDEYGYITGLKKGTVKVTVTLSNGKKKTKKIKVK